MTERGDRATHLQQIKRSSTKVHLYDAFEEFLLWEL